MKRDSSGQSAKYENKVSFKSGFTDDHQCLKSDDRLAHTSYASTSVPQAMAVSCNEKEWGGFHAVGVVIAEKTGVIYEKVTAAHRKLP